MKRTDFSEVTFAKSVEMTGRGQVDMVVIGRDCVRFSVRVTERSECDVMSFDREDYDGDSGVYDHGYEVIISTPESEEAGEFLHVNCFRNLWEAVEYINIKTVPEGYVYIASEREW